LALTQANSLLAVRANDKELKTLVRTFERPMGLAADGSRLALGMRKEIWTLRNGPDIAPCVEPVGTLNACFVQRSSHVTGDIGLHEIARADAELWLDSTRFSCLAALKPDYSFVPRWRPPFISAIAAEDRCHLNDLAIVEGRTLLFRPWVQPHLATGQRRASVLLQTVVSRPELAKGRTADANFYFRNKSGANSRRLRRQLCHSWPVSGET
jgi:uncharacterized protein (TIGR03032 family)